jgi:hypothetical protein
VADWLGEQAPVDRDAALAELARRYLAGHRRAEDRDLANWAGVTLRDARAGLAAIAGELEQDGDGLLSLAGSKAADLEAVGLPSPRLLGVFEPVLLGWRSREPILGRDEARVIRGGLFRAFALVGGRAAATWTMPSGQVALEPFRRLPGEVRVALASDGEDVARFLRVARE